MEKKRPDCYGVIFKFLKPGFVNLDIDCYEHA